MPKKNDELKVKARELYEQEGFSLANIARKLDINVSTVKTWKRRDKWLKPESRFKSESMKPPKRIQNPNSLANLQPPEMNKHPNVGPGNKLAEKHGLYSDHSNTPKFESYRNKAHGMTDEELAREVLERSYANFMVAMDRLDANNLAYMEPAARVETMIVNMSEKPGKIHATDLDNQMREYRLEEYKQQLAGESPELEILDRYIEAVELDAARDSEFDSDSGLDS